MPPVDKALRDAFETVESEGIPAPIADHVERLIDGQESADERH
ncbi:hypothetical protein GGQ87_002899 [Brevundimonas alba]|uniref:Uncharacterized protein n=1 Tax=Brevundimonas alba TaxID=74314 RepID=A0A7X6BQ46_9CAUL|nr:hypothetical protein [Brevundimonas alba]NJC42604.1 hypothetical protein [Brevundimonas alba]